MGVCHAAKQLPAFVIINPRALATWKDSLRSLRETPMTSARHPCWKAWYRSKPRTLRCPSRFQKLETSALGSMVAMLVATVRSLSVQAPRFTAPGCTLPSASRRLSPYPEGASFFAGERLYQGIFLGHFKHVHGFQLCLESPLIRPPAVASFWCEDIWALMFHPKLPDVLTWDSVLLERYAMGPFEESLKPL